MTHSLTTPAAAAPRRRRVVRTVLALAVAGAVVATVVVLVSGAGASSDPADAPAVLVTQADFQPAPPPCLMHQTEQPNSAYEGGPDSQPPQQLTFLAYYTAAGKEPFCDGGTATDTDKAWAQLYVQLTTSADNVSTVLG